MSYLNAYIATIPGYGWEGGPEFKTRIVEMANGRERRNAEWANARHTFNAPFDNINHAAYREIKRMHLVCRGRLHAFKFKDQLDFIADDEIFGSGDGTTKIFQLNKVSTIDTLDYVRNCYAIVFANITANDIAVVPTIDLERGLVTFDTAPADGVILRWSGEFDVWVRFAQDNLPFSIDSFRVHNGSIDLIEVPPPEL